VQQQQQQQQQAVLVVMLLVLLMVLKTLKAAWCCSQQHQMQPRGLTAAMRPLRAYVPAAAAAACRAACSLMAWMTQR
jgi:hypothetical protein